MLTDSKISFPEAALQVVSEIDRIIFKLHCFGIEPEDIAMIINSTENAVQERIVRITDTLNEFTAYLKN